MKAIDTNVVIRVITCDDAVQTPIADNIIASGPVLLTVTVLMECEWVLRSQYHYPRDLIASALLRFMDVETVVPADRSRFNWALECYSEGADLADMLHIATAFDAETFVTFDRNIVRHVRDVRMVIELA